MTLDRRLENVERNRCSGRGVPVVNVRWIDDEQRQALEQERALAEHYAAHPEDIGQFIVIHTTTLVDRNYD